MEKYKPSQEIIPQEARKEINEKILYLINNNLCEQYGITQEDVFNSYTGKGGLTGLNFKDYNSYYDFSQDKKLIEQGEFYTPSNVCKFIMDILKPAITDSIVDITAGIGNFCNYALTESNFYLNDIDINNIKIMKYLYPNANITSDDISFYKPSIQMDYVIGNPPYGLRWKVEKTEYLSQFYYCVKAQQILKPLGFLCIVVPNSFMNDEFIDQSTIKYMDNNFNFVCQFDLPTNSFKRVGINHIETKVVIFQKKSKHVEQYNKYSFEKITITELSEQMSNNIYNTYIKPLQEQKESLKSKLFLENVHSIKTNKKEYEEFNFKVQKLLFDIKRNPKISKYYNKGLEYYNNYFTQRKLENLNWQQWEEIRITKKKVIKYLKNILKKQSIKQEDKVKLVKTNYGLKLKGYSDKMEEALSKYNNTYNSFNNMVLENNYSFDNKKYYKLYQKKLRQYNNQSQYFDDMQEDLKIKNWLNKVSFINNESEEVIQLNDIQKNIVNKMLQKKYGYIQSSQGTGKTLMAIAYGLYRKETTKIKNIFCVAPSIAINGTWETTLTDYNIPFMTLKTFSDIERIQEGVFVLITFNMLIKLKNRLKKYLHRIGNNYVLLVDEADSIARFESKRTKATIGTFKKARYKLLLSGTMTRNNITEAYTQFNLMYGASINFLSKNKYIMEEDKITKELVEVYNHNYMKPIPEYRKGMEIFKNSFNPQKVTVFGVSQNTQDVYNSSELKDLINKSIITKTFEDVVGKKIYNIIQHTVKFNNNESILYNKAINDFFSMKYLFSSTGNPRKDRMMEIIQQITLLLNICQHPQVYKEYKTSETPAKYKKVLSLLMKWNNEKVAIGCRTIKEVECYSSLIRNHFPNRKLFVVTGNSTTMKQRKEIVKTMKESDNAILLSTQQSLSSSISIEYINKVICTALAWNWSSLSQYFFRFIRYNSKDNKEVHFITYENSLESNLLSLLMAKENLTLFMKNQELEDDELYEQFGIDFNLIDMLLTKEKDKEGKSYIRWGQQNII